MNTPTTPATDGDILLTDGLFANHRGKLITVSFRRPFNCRYVVHSILPQIALP